MRLFTLLLLPFLLCAQPDRDLSGVWKLNRAASSIRDSPAPAGFLRIEQNAAAVTVFSGPSEGAPAVKSVYPLNGKPLRTPGGDITTNIVAKWEGTALLANVIVSGREDYSARERWSRSGDGARLTVTRTISRANGETESTFVYENPRAVPEPPPPAPTSLTSAAPPLQPEASSPSPAAANRAQEVEGQITVPAGTRILLRLTNAVNTKHTAPGDRIYLQTAVPVFINRRSVIPVGSYVTGTVLESQRAGRVKGLSALNLRFDTLTLPNGVTRDFRSRPGSVDARGSLDRSEGRIKGESDKGGDARKVAKTTAAGTGVGTLAGSIAGHAGMGAGIGAAAGALGGLAGVLGSRGADVVLPPGTSMEMVLDREIQFSVDELPGRER